MTIKEISSFQIGDELQLPTGVIVNVKTINRNEKKISFSMLGGSTTVGCVPAFGEIPPEKLNAETTVVCEWADLVNATRLME